MSASPLKADMRQLPRLVRSVVFVNPLVQWLSRLNTLCGPLRSLQNAVADVRRTSIWSGYSRHLETTVARKLMP